MGSLFCNRHHCHHRDNRHVLKVAVLMECLESWREHGLVHTCWMPEDHSGHCNCKDFDCGSQHWKVRAQHEIHNEPGEAVRGFLCRNCGNPVLMTLAHKRMTDLIRAHEKECFA